MVGEEKWFKHSGKNTITCGISCLTDSCLIVSVKGGLATKQINHGLAHHGQREHKREGLVCVVSYVIIRVKCCAASTFISYLVTQVPTPLVLLNRYRSGTAPEHVGAHSTIEP